MRTARKQKQTRQQWSPVANDTCACGRCPTCERQRRREQIARAYDHLFIGCDTARPDRADEVLLLTAA